MNRSLVLFLSLMMAAAASTMAQSSPKGDPDLDTLLVWIEGNFSSAHHTRLDSTYQELRLTIERVWPTRTDGAWYRVERVSRDSSTQPWRRRFFRIQRVEEGMLELLVYDEPRSSSSSTAASAEQLSLRRGCELYLQATGASYVGSTHGTACASDVAGTSYAGTELELFADRLLWWERGYDAGSLQVWGPTKGPYVLERE